MSKLDKFTIHFTGDYGVFHSGEIISGLVSFQLSELLEKDGDYGVFQSGEIISGLASFRLSELLETDGIYLRLKGEGTVSFQLPGGNGHADYSAREIYLDECIQLLQPEDGESKVDLKPGKHEYKFNHKLPPSLPTSFEGEFGSVRYSAICTIEKSGVDEYNVIELFSVIGRLDLNLEKNVEGPFHQEDNREDGCCFCYDNGDISVSLDLDRLGYVPGESIPVTGEINNRTSGFVRTSVQLIQTATYRCPDSERPKITKDVMAEIGEIELEPRSKFVHSREKIRVPSLPPSRLDGCSFIDIAYNLKLKATTDFSGLTCKVVADLIIGTIPLRSEFNGKSVSGLPSSSSAPLALSEEDGTDKHVVTKGASSEQPTSVVENSASGGIVVKHDDDVTAEASTSFSYTPKYPVVKY